MSALRRMSALDIGMRNVLFRIRKSSSDFILPCARQALPLRHSLGVRQEYNRICPGTLVLDLGDTAVFLGSVSAVESQEWLQENGITYVIECRERHKQWMARWRRHTF